MGDIVERWVGHSGFGIEGGGSSFWEDAGCDMREGGYNFVIQY